MSYLKKEYQNKVFKYAVEIAHQKQKASGGRLAWPNALKRAWKDPRVLARKEAYYKKRDAYNAKMKKSSKSAPKSKAKSKSAAKKR